MSCRKPTRAGWGWLEETGEKVRISKKSGEVIPKPAELFDWIPKKEKTRQFVGSKDTPAPIALRRTFKLPICLEDQKYIPKRELQEIFANQTIGENQ